MAFPNLPAVLVLVLIVVLIGVSVLVVVLILIIALVLILVLIIHNSLPPKFSCGVPAALVCPALQALSLALKRILAARPATIAAVIPPAAAFSPPVKIPWNPSC